jgi:RNA polymerase sigma-70 factor (ECF subfamily)
VVRIARNEALRHLARLARSQDLYTQARTEALDGVSAGQETPVRAEILDLREAMAELAPRDALLLRLRYERDLTQPRVARLAGMPEGTVKIRLHRIRGRLRERLSESR